MSAHTPGPWSYSVGNLVRVYPLSDRGSPICGVHRRGRHLGRSDEREVIANAVLIAASPKMLAALEEAADAIKEYQRYRYGGEMRGSYDGKPELAGLWKAMHSARAALAAAKGEA